MNYLTKQELVQKAVEAINKMSPAEKQAARDNLKRKLIIKLPSR